MQDSVNHAIDCFKWVLSKKFYFKGKNNIVMEGIMMLRASKQVLSTVMILSFRTDRSGQTVQTQIRLLLEEQSDQGLHCLPFCLHRLDALLYL